MSGGAHPQRGTDAGDASAWYARRPWLAHYPPGIPADVRIEPDGTIRGLLLAACAAYPARIAFELDEGRSEDAQLTFGEWRRQADALARFLVHECAIETGDRILLLMPNLPAYPLALLAAWLAGAVAIPVYTAATPHELEGLLRTLEPRAAIAFAPLAHALRSVPGAERTRIIEARMPGAEAAPARPAMDGITLDEAVARGLQLPAVERAARPGDAAVLLHTGGTTSAPKAVVLTQGSLRVGIDMVRAATGDDPDGGRVVGIHPFAHATGLSVNLLHQASKGMTQVLFPDYLATGRVVASWRARPFHFLQGGPMFYVALMSTPGFAELDFSALRIAVTGGMALREDIRERWEGATGKPLRLGYGLTETSVPIAAELLDANGDGERFPGSAGFPLPSVEVTLRDPDAADFPAVAPGAIGEVWLRGAFLMDGYFRRPEATADTVTPDGWLRTGDLGRMNDAGALYLLGRIKDVIVVGGLKAYPASIEDVVGACPDVADVCAVPMPDPECGERVRLFVVRRDPALDAATIAAWCEQRLSAFKRPARIDFIDALPRSSVDKMLRRELSLRPLD